MEGSNHMWRGAIAGGEERSLVEGSDRRQGWRVAITTIYQWRGEISGGAERASVDESDRRWMGAMGGERSLVEAPGAIAG